MKRSLLFRILSSILTLCLLVAPFIGLIPSVSAEDAGDLWTKIEAMRDGVFKKGGKAPSVEAFAAISDDIYALVEQSGEALPGTLQAKGDFISWRDLDGIPCCYSPAHEADKAAAGSIAPKPTESKVLLTTPAVAGNAEPSSSNIGLIQPFYRDASHYYDRSFTTYSPAYVTQANELAAKTGGQVIRYSLEDATLDTIASTLEECGMVIFDSHGGTDYSSGEDHSSRANCSYIWLSSGYSTSMEFKQHWSDFLSREEYYSSHTGPYGTYEDVYLSSDGSYCVNGRLIASHMKKDAPNSLVYLSTCLSMATDGLEAPLRAKGVEAVYGYSQSVTFAGDRNYMTVITNGLIGGMTLGEAVANAKTILGNWDNYNSYFNTIEMARAYYCSFPIVASSEDAYPGHGNADDLQTVNSSWTLLPRYKVTATANDNRLGTLQVSQTTITATPAAGYYVQSAEVISGTGTCTVSGNTIEVDAHSDCTVLVTFAPKSQVTLTLAGSDAEPITGTAGSTVTLPLTAAPQAGMEFIGWTENLLEQRSTELPAYYEPGSSFTLPRQSTTLYALYTYFDETVVRPITPRYVRVSPDDDFAAVVADGRSFLIATELSSYAMVFNGSRSTLYASKNYENVSYLNGEKGVLPCNSTTTACAVRIAPISGTSDYSLRLKNGSGSYVKCNQAIGIATSSSAYPLTIEITAADCHYIRDTAVRNYRFLTHTYTDGNYSFGFTNGQCVKTVLYRYEDEVSGQRYYLTAGEACPHTTTILTDAVAPTCESVGYTGNTVCADCGFVLSASTRIPALGHDIIYHAAKDATCTEIGWNEYETCTRCDYTTYHEIPALEHHIVEHAAKAPTCTTIGWDAYQTCSECGYSNYHELPALGHDIIKHDAKAPTCTEIGWTAYESCSRCDYTTYEELMRLYHNIVKYEAKAPTCTEVGWASYTACTRCSYTTYREIAALGHDLQDNAAKAPTCTTAGWDAYQTCSRCDHSTYQEVAALGHTVIEHEAKAPTCTEIGWNDYETCACCDYSTYQELPALGHNFIDGSCICGETMEIKSAALHLNEDINMAYAVKLPEEAEDPYMVFTCNGEEHIVDTFTLDDEGQCCFEFMDINPQCMGDNITATLHATVGGEEVTDTVGNYSVREYCVNQIEKTTDPEMKTLLSDILTYGAAAQIYSDYHTEHLITDGLDLTPRTFEPIKDKTVFFTGDQDENTRWISAALILSNDFAARFTFVTDNIDGLIVEVSINGRTQRFDTFEQVGDGRYSITFEGIKVTELDDTVTASFLRDGEQLGAAVHYSVNTYICGAQNSTDKALASLVQALSNYGTSATAYVSECSPG